MLCRNSAKILLEQTGAGPELIELLRTNDIVVISLVETLLHERGIGCFVADEFTASIEGSLGILPRRVLVPSADISAARRILRDAGLGMELPGV